MPPGAASSGGIASWDHDNDRSTPPKTVVPGIDSLFESPDANNVFGHQTFMPKTVDPDDVTGITTAQLNPCATAVCTVEETVAGKDNLPDLVITTKANEPSYTILNNPFNPGELQLPIAIGSDENDDRDVEIADMNLDGVPDLIIASHGARNRVFFGDPVRPGDYSSTKHDEFGADSDGTISVEVIDLDDDASTPPDILVVNADTYDQLYLGSQTAVPGAGTGIFSEKYTEVIIPGSYSFESTDIAVAQGLGNTHNSFCVVITNAFGANSIFELDAAKKASILDGTSPLSNADVFTLDSDAVGMHTSTVEVADVTNDGVPDVIVAYKNSPNDVAGHVYPGAANAHLTDNVFASDKIPIGSASIPGVQLVLVDTDGDGTRESIEILDENGGVHYFENSGSNTWSSAIYPDPNLPQGTTAPAVTAHDYQDAHGIVATADFDGDGFADVISGNQLLLSSLAVDCRRRQLQDAARCSRGDLSSIPPINYDHGAAPLAVIGGDFDGDSDEDLFVIPGPPGNSGSPTVNNGKVPYILLNRGDGRLDLSERVELSQLSWGGLLAGDGWTSRPDYLAAGRLGDQNADSIVVGFADATNSMLVLKPQTISGPDGTATATDWESTAANSIQTIVNSASQITQQVLIVDLDQDGSNEVVHLHDSGTIDIYSSSGSTSSVNGVTLTIEKSLSVPGGAAKIQTGDIDGDGVRDIVSCIGTSCTVFWGDTLPVANGDPPLALGDWGTSHDTIVVAQAGYSVEDIIVFDADQNGYSDILFTATDASGRTRRAVVYSSDTAALQRDLSGIAPVDLELTDEAGVKVSMMMSVDANKDGAGDLIYARTNGRSQLILATVAARTDLSALAYAGTGIVDHLAAEINPSVTPDRLTCQTNSADSNCVPSTDGAWVATQSNAGGDVATWGNGQVITDPGQQTITVGSPVKPSDPSVADHGPPCALPGSDVVPVQTEFYVEVSFQ